MSKSFRFSAMVVGTIVVIGACVCWRGCGRNRDALATYKAELRAKGERLTAEELGYPKSPEKSPGLDRLLAATGKLGAMRVRPSALNAMTFTGPGKVELVWTSPQLVTDAKGKAFDWETITAQFTNEAGVTLELRDAVQIPPRYFYNDPTNFSTRPVSPFVGIRAAAQWLGADAVVALREHRVGDAALDIHALAQLVQFHREDHTLVSQMIRVAIAGLGLSVTWQGLHAEGWNEELLAGLQHDWETVNLAESFETGMVGERAFGETAFSMMRAASPSERLQRFRFSTATVPFQLRSPKDYFEAYVVMPFWAANADVDEMFFLQHQQRNLEAVRKLRTGAVWSEVNSELSSNIAVLDTALNSPIAKYRHLFSAVAIPNSLKAAGVCVRNETQRRMTVIAIALERSKLRTGNYPANLDALVPGFLSSTPVDPMSGKPFGYRLNPDKTFTLYSIGEDGRDDGGDATSAATNRFDLWSGRDAVWPKAAAREQ